MNRSIDKSPSQIIYGSSPINAFELRQLDKGEISIADAEDFAKHLKTIHEELSRHIIKMNT